MQSRFHKEDRLLNRVFAKPRVVISKCLTFDACRYNGQKIEDSFVSRLVPHIDVVTVCPEVEIGLGIPRDPIRLVRQAKTLHLRQPATGRDVTQAMSAFAERFLHSLANVDGFILKSRSPTCGIKDVKLYPSVVARTAGNRTAGLFGDRVLTRFPQAAIEDEGRLRNFRIREHFLTKLFTIAQFRQVKNNPSIKAMIAFHAANKFLMMAYHQEAMRELGRRVAKAQVKQMEKFLEDYQGGLNRVFSKMARATSHINVLMHAMGHFSDQLNNREKKYFLDVLEDYRAGRVPLSQAIGIMQSWIVRFDASYLAQQTYFQPYPMELVEITDSGKGRGT